jgi:hypothetical protein
MSPRLSALVLVAVACLVAGCGGSRKAHSETVAKELRARLVARDLPPRWVACVPTRFAVRGKTAYRCNVNFGDPHVAAYCAAFVGTDLAYSEWRIPVQGRQDRVASQRECVRKLSARLG